MSDDLKVDWTRPIEAYHEDGRVAPATIKGREVHWGQRPGAYSSIVVNGQTAYPGWRIRNVAEPAQPDIGIAMTEDLAKRMEALVRRMAVIDYGEINAMPKERADAHWEARAIVALLPEPVDADLVEVRRIVADALPHGMRADILSGAQDHTASIQAPLACLKAGRALERDSREG